MKHPEAQFLHQRNTDLHNSEEVMVTVGYLRSKGEHIPNQPDAKIAAHIGFLAAEANDGILTGDQASIDRQIELKIIAEEDVPEAYFDLQRQIAREQGHGDIVISSQQRREMIEAIQADQRASLETWVEYLGGQDGGYPDWFKMYVWESVTKLGKYDKEKQEFQKRSKGTTAPYPELNREALAYVFDSLDKSRIKGETADGGANNETLQQLLKGGNFAKLYVHAILEVTPDSPELRENIQGSWTTYNQTNDPRTARRLAESLQGHGTGWCTAGEGVAQSQLQKGDFYVYYSEDSKGNNTVPRVAVRMEYGRVAEVRGIDPSQNMEASMVDIALEKVKDLPGGEEYLVIAEDMRRLTDIESRLKADPEAELSANELRFLYEMDKRIVGFGYSRDPRIDEIKDNRGCVKDLCVIFSTTDQNKLIQEAASHDFGEILDSITKHLHEFDQKLDSASADILMKCNLAAVINNHEKFMNLDQQSLYRRAASGYEVGVLVENLDTLRDIDHKELCEYMVSHGYGYLVADNLDKFKGINHEELVNKLLDRGQTRSVAYNLPKFKNVDYDAILLKLCDMNEVHSVSGRLQVVDGPFSNELAEKLIEKGHILAVANNLEKFPSVDHSELLDNLLKGPFEEVLLYNFEKFDTTDHQKIVDTMFANGRGTHIPMYINKLDVDHVAVARRLVDMNRAVEVLPYIDKFKGLDEALVEEIKTKAAEQMKVF